MKRSIFSSFKKNRTIFADDVLTGTAEITGLTVRNEKNGIVGLTINVRNQHGELVLSDVTEAVVKRRRV